MEIAYLVSQESEMRLVKRLIANSTINHEKGELIIQSATSHQAFVAGWGSLSMRSLLP